MNKHKTLNILAFLFCTFIFPVQVQAVGLKENSVITDNTIKLGDIFYGLDKDGDKILGAAPAPGKEMVLTARTLLRIALALDLQWRPTDSAEFITLRRQATIIDADSILARLKEALAENNVYGDYTVVLSAEYQQIILPYDQPPTMEITDVRVDKNGKSFTAMVAAPSSDNPIQNFRVRGEIQPVIKVPVLVENVQNGRVIDDNDLEYIEINERDYTRDMIADAQNLVGLTARRMIVAGRPVRSSDLISPLVVQRGELVTLGMNNGVLNISTQVKALEGGAKGDIIRVVNTASNTTIQAMVTGIKEVQVIND